MLTKKRKYLIAIALVLTLLLSTGMVAYATEYLEQDDNGKMWFETNVNANDEEGDSNYAFNIQGYVGEDLLQTTYNNNGYEVFLKEDGDDEATQVGTAANGVERIVGEIGFTNRLTFVNGGNYVKAEYIIRNTTSSDKTVSIATTSDTQIGNLDYAPMEITSSAIIMRDGDNAQFNIVCKDAYGVTDVDGMWIGYYDYQWSEMFSNEDPMTLTETDSGLAFSWTGINLPANGTKTFSVLFGVGAVNDAPDLGVGTLPTTVTPGQELTIYGEVSDTENTIDTKVYYILDDGEPVLLYSFDEEPGLFQKKVVLPTDANFTGEHILMFYAEDENGATSSTQKRTFTVETQSAAAVDEVASEMSPVTGDESQLGLWILMLLAVAGIVYTTWATLRVIKNTK